jgi:hypothetical protein
VAIDFDGNGLHHAVLPRRESMDVLEISIGLRRGWLRRGDSAWIDVIETAATREVGNYEWMHGLADAIDPDAPPLPVWESFVADRRRRRGAVPTIFLNPLSSKPIPWGTEDWAALVGSIARAAGAIRVSIYPGVDAESAADAEAIAAALRRLPDVQAEILRESLTPYNGLKVIARELARADVCLTIDTFTAHLAPLFRVPTIVMTLKDNRAFWVACPWSFYVLPDEVTTLVPAIAIALLAPPSAVLNGAAGRVREATTGIGNGAEAQAALARLNSSLALLVPRFHAASPFQPSARQWLQFWARVGAAARQSPVAASDLSHFVAAWRSSTFYRLFIETR